MNLARITKFTGRI